MSGIAPMSGSTTSSATTQQIIPKATKVAGMDRTYSCGASYAKDRTDPKALAKVVHMAIKYSTTPPVSPKNIHPGLFQPKAPIISKGKRENIYDGYDEGTFHNGKLEGPGRRSARCCNFNYHYEGEFSSGEMTSGTLVKIRHADKLQFVYKGSFKNGLYHGQGKQCVCTGVVNEGTWAFGKLNGQGKISRPNGDFVEGIFKNDILVKGKALITKDECTFSGNCEGEKLVYHGHGVFYFKNGDIWAGEFNQGNFVGGFIQITKDGNAYTGEAKAKNNRLVFEGRGKCTFANGNIQDGFFFNGTFLSGTETIRNSDGTTTQRMTPPAFL